MGKEISGTIIFPVFIKKASPSHNRFSELFTHEERLVTSNMFFLYRGMNFEDFRGNVFELNFSNSPGITFLRDNSWQRSARNDALSKWLKSLYWMILGFRFTWKVFKTVNANLWKSNWQACLINTWRIEIFRVICQNVVKKCWIIRIFEASGLSDQIP